MAYMQQNAFAFAPQPQPQFFYHPDQYHTYVAHPQQAPDEFYMPYAGAEYADFMEAGMMHDDMGESQEISTRPRLTKEQAEVLEAHFQANHKPSSQLKRELAIQTGLTLNRVGNWFQNRRAKAKQQKRQEEYEAQTSSVNVPSNEPEGDEEAEDVKDAKSSEDSRSEAVSPTGSASPTKASSTTTTTDSTSAVETPDTPVQAVDNSKEASWNSLQRALGQAKAARAHLSGQAQVSMSPPKIPARAPGMQLPLRLNHHQTTPSASYVSAWRSQHANYMAYPSPITLQDTSFDFGFGNDIVDQAPAQESTIDPVVDYAQDSFVVTPQDFQEPLATPKGITHQQNDPMTALPSPGFSMPSYPGSRRPSATEDLSATFGNVALAGTPPNFVPELYGAASICPPPSGPLDIAARRKRPRPAALTSASLRSRSYGAMTSVSPTFRQGIMSPQGPHSVRHVKSAGQSLHSRYAGIRKASSAQRSPMCATTFAEADAFNQLMAQQAIATAPLTEMPEPLLSPDHVSHDFSSVEPEKNPFFIQNMDMSNQYSMPPPQNLSITTASPPATPMIANFMSRGPSQQSLMPPASAPPQYATFPDYTPPYSAGPLTNSSWSDAPMTSPDVPSFPVTYISSVGFPQHYDAVDSQIQQYVLRSDNKSEVDFDSHFDQKKMEFCIQEFPNQKQEHAHVAQQLAQQKPKAYVFANTAPQDYNGA
ncbi:hypothetical protein G647_05771 [Cladophialophora carrionii CBS 160.54]|uniref:Homeobox domain-containing protein n=1 Tax=Cladophialophora carrionii CBS 160.54 TaxID=1279043 RepID=V9DAN2_9EURO|nr:uncharacterized protein G647_05771 [Cladophialophora carrionii CBS 160.54]ETI23964.1 hypothetical protein G647_05771 [Cladophialophora carrionii CBS 160.54]